MPNWCNNALIFDSKEDYEKIKGYARFQKDDEGGDENFDFASFISPDIELLNKYDWYNWNIQQWGCKWNSAYTVWDDETNTISFDTPWNGISDGLLREISRTCKNKITYYYAEPSMDFGGGLTLLNGLFGEETYEKQDAYEYFEYEFEEKEN